MKSKHSEPQGKDFKLRDRFTERYFENNGCIPVSFKVDGMKVGLDGLNRYECKPDSRAVSIIYTGVKNGLEVTVNANVYSDYPAVEWSAEIKNVSDKNSGIISEFYGCDSEIEGNDARLWYCSGDYYSENGYAPFIADIDKKIILSPESGRSCDGAFPYFRLLFENRTILCAVGWPGRWMAELDCGNRLSLKSGQHTLNTYLKPGESIKAPSMTMLFCEDTQERAILLWRRYYMAHIIPCINGKPLPPFLTCTSNEDGEEFTESTEKIQLDSIKLCREHGIKPDIWWIDAGWYKNGFKDGKPKWWMTGNWEIDDTRFPRGLKPVSEELAKFDCSLLVWFEPERVHDGMQHKDIKPEWLLARNDKSDKNRLLNLGDENCLMWLTEHVCKLIKDNGIKVYRQDFNFDPLLFWRDNEEDDRKGILENKYARGYLKYWDEILKRNPGLWIDSCASGGRRNDIETMKRSVPLHYTDYGYGNLPVKTAFQQTLYEWIPYFKEFALSWDMNESNESKRFEQRFDAFSYHCGFGPMFFLLYDQRNENLDYAEVSKYINIWRKAAEYIFDDFYALTEWSRETDKWVVWQFDNPDKHEGVIRAMRHKDCEDDSITVRLKNICIDKTYTLTNLETGESKVIQGDSLTLSMPRRSGQIWAYKGC